MATAFWMHGKLPSLNELLEDRARGFYDRRKGKRFHEDRLKKACMEKVVIRARASKFMAPSVGCWTYLFREPDRTRDPLNILAGAVKIIEDALVTAGMSPGDGWNSVRALRPHFDLDSDEPGVLVAWDPNHEFDYNEMLDIIDRMRGPNGQQSRG